MHDRVSFPRALRALHSQKRRRLASVAALLLASIPVRTAALPTLAVEATSRAAEQPALWVLSDADTTIYLFGTFHALDERTDWLARPIRAAFDSADELVLETVVPSDPRVLLGALARHEMIAAPAIGAPLVTSGRPSFADTARATMAAGRSAGLKVDRGADAVLRRIADSEGKPVDGLETFDFQLGMVKALPGTTPTTGIPSKSAPNDMRQALLDMRSAWRRGDGSRFAAVLGNLEAQSPATYRRLFVDRNTHWASWIADRMQRPGTVFVAVGTGHLIGRDSVQRKLAGHGYRTMRIQ